MASSISKDILDKKNSNTAKANNSTLPGLDLVMSGMPSVAAMHNIWSNITLMFTKTWKKVGKMNQYISAEDYKQEQ